MNPIITKRELREGLIERVRLAKMTKEATKTQKECDHDFETFKETIRPTTNFAMTAFFTVKGCVKCHMKIRINYTVV